MGDIGGSGDSSGLSTEEARRRLAQGGPNAIPQEKRHPVLRLVLRFWGPIPWLIEVAIALELALGHTAEATILCFLLVFNAAVGWFQEGRAHSAVSALMVGLARQSRALRDGAWSMVPSEDLVQGDLVNLRAGDLVPADGTVVAGEVLLDQSSVTGESAPAEAGAGASAFSGSLVQRGEARMTVTATGGRTKFGRATLLISGDDRRSRSNQLFLALSGCCLRWWRCLRWSCWPGVTRGASGGGSCYRLRSHCW